MVYKYATIDIETTGLNRYKDNITWVGIGLSKALNDDIAIKTFDISDSSQKAKCIKALKGIKEKGIKLIWQNGKFDTLFIEHHFKVKLPIHDDVMLLGTAYDLAEKHGLKYMAQKYLGVPDWDISKKEKTSETSDKVKPYLRKDVLYTWQLFCWFKQRLTEQQLEVYQHILRPAYRMYRDVERNGIYVDIPALHSVKDKYKELEKETKDKLLSRYNINWNSSGQVAEVLFEKEGLPVIKKSEKTGKPSADASVLKKLTAQGYDLPKMILDYKAANTLNKMFLNRWEDDLGTDKRIHPSFNLTNVVSGRTSCQNPNLQQVPRTKDVRSIYKAPPGRLFFEADYSQLELRIAADYANEPTMLKIYNEGGDIHTATAKLMTNGREPTKEERGKAKAVSGIISRL